MRSPVSLPDSLVIGVSAMRPAIGTRPASTRSRNALAPGPEKRNLQKPVVSIMPTAARTARVSARTRSQALERPNVTCSVGSSPGAWNHRADSSPKLSPNTALWDARRSCIGEVCTKRPSGRNSLGNVIRKRRP